MARATRQHIQQFAYNGSNNRHTVNPNRTACGRLISVIEANAVWPSLVTAVSSTVDCAGCRKQLDMTPHQHRTHVADQAAKLAEVRTSQKARAEEERRVSREAGEAMVALYREEAVVAQDAYLEGTEYPGMQQILTAALVAYKLQNTRTRGDNLYITSGPPRASARTVSCRFCRYKIGETYHNQVMTQLVWDRETWNWYGSWLAAEMSLGPDDEHVGVSLRERFVEIGRHTTLCALAYLAGIQCAEPVA